MLDRPRNDDAPRIVIGHIVPEEQGRFAQLGGKRLSSRRVDVGDDDACAFLDEARCGGGTHSVGSARDDRDEAVKPAHYCRAHAAPEASAAPSGAVAGVISGSMADAELMATDLREFDSWHPWPIEADRAIDLALACEDAGRQSDRRVENSDGASVGTGENLGVYANSHGFFGRERGTQHSVGCALIAGKGDAMQRDGWYSIGLSADDLESAVTIGRKAAERAVSRLAPRQLATGQYPVLFASEVARSMVGHLLGAVSGGALYRRATFLLDRAGTPLFPDWFGSTSNRGCRR